ncbi:MAG TPA: DMT family transporter [Synergistaceae bacterium]|jgi:drug/metabolite transporter (DMT)-like permease|nr:DMT family transporter [Synergistaceae bacterium]NLL41593.1 DMT family transporter [Synergistaceae bacterium]HPX03874.1 DMT family transporter [Synergistaceae bacterium]HQA54817.1 DMT family transporter [Synergistaceae bacterium]
MPEKNESSANTARPRDYIIILAAIAIWSASFAGMKVAVEQAHPLVVLWLRLGISIPFLFAGSYLQRSFRLPTRQELLPLLIMSFQGIFLVLGLQNFAMKTASAATANWIIICSPAFVALLGRLFLKEKMSLTSLAGLILSAIGVMVVLRLGTVSGPNETGSFGTVGDLLILFSSLNWSIFLVFSRKVLREDLRYSFVLFWEMFFSFIYATLSLPLIGSDISVICSFTHRTWTAVAFLGAGASAAAYFCWFHGLSVLPVSRIVAFQFLQPFAGAMIAFLLLGERFTLWLFAGGITIIYGVYLVNKK